MKKRVLIAMLAVLALAILLAPVKLRYRDGGTRVYASLTYRVVVLHAVKPAPGHAPELLTGTYAELFPLLRGIPMEQSYQNALSRNT